MIAAMMPAAWLLLPALLLPVPVGQPATTQSTSTRTAGTSPAERDRDFWRAIVKTDYAVPANESVVPLARELSGMLASPDPELRDEFGYSILAAWIHEKKLIEPATLRELIAEWTKNQNLTNLISKLYIVLAMQNTPGDGARAALERVSVAVKTLF
jgi:hypothetical protein